MDARMRIERTLERTIAQASEDVCPPGLASAVHHAVFPGGARVRPLLCLGVASACAGAPAATSLAAAVSIELLHCASLVHDDLPCFDDAETRRGKPSVHRAYGEPIAILTGDALIVLAFEALARACADTPHVLPPLLSILSRATGMSGGLVAGQAWESEPVVSVPLYHAAKTGSMFVAAVKAGAASIGGDARGWEPFGALLGEAYQVADDIRDVASTASELGKPVGRDAALGRPSACAEMGIDGAKKHLDRLIERALDKMPSCPGAEDLKSQVRQQVRWFVPDAAAQVAA